MEGRLEKKLRELNDVKKEEEVIRNSFLDHDTLFETVSLGYDFVLDRGDNKPSNKIIFENENSIFYLGLNKKESLFYLSVLPKNANDSFTENRLNELINNRSYKFSRFKTKRIFKKENEEYRFIQDKDTGKMIMSYSAERRTVLYFFMVLARFYSNLSKIKPVK